MPLSRGRVDPSRPTTEALQREVKRLGDLLDVRLDAADRINLQRWAAVERQFGMIEEQRKEQKQDTKEAVDAALVAQKQAVEKTEIAVSKQLDQLRDTFAAERRADQAAISDLKDRIGAAEQQKAGGKSLVANVSAGVGLVLALGLIYGIVSALP